MKLFLSFSLFFAMTFGLLANKSSHLNEDVILTLPTGEFKLHQFVKRVEELNPFINIVSKGLPKADRIEFSKGSRFKNVFRNLTQFQEILIKAENAAGGEPKFDLLEDRLTITWSRITQADFTEVHKGRTFTPPAGEISQAYRINGTLVIDRFLKYDFKEPVVVDGDMVVNSPDECNFTELTVNGTLTISKGSKISAEQILIRGEVLVKDEATVETVDVVFDGDGDLILGRNSTLLMTDTAITAN